MAEDIFSIQGIPKKRIGISGTASSPASGSEPPISSAKSNTGSLPGRTNADVTARENVGGQIPFPESISVTTGPSPECTNANTSSEIATPDEVFQPESTSISKIETKKDTGTSVSRLEWPPHEADLRRLYVEQQLSAAKIALAYGRKTPNPRSAPELIRYHLKRYGIKRRDRVEELRRETKSTVDAWSVRHPYDESTSQDMSAEAGAVLELLRVPNLSIEHLDELAKRRVDAVMRHLYHRRGLSESDIAKLIGKKSRGYVAWLFGLLAIPTRDFEEARIKAIGDKVRKYERKPFDGKDEDKAYLLGLRQGDLHVATPWKGVIDVSTSTTHPAMIQLFRDLFCRYGHVYMFARYKHDTDTYGWNLRVILDNSFQFLLLDKETVWEWVSQKESTLYAYLAGIWDAEGSVGIHPNARVVSIRLSVYNTDTELLRFVNQSLITLGYRPKGLYKEKSEGERTSKYDIPHRKDHFRVALFNLDESQSLLGRLPLLHGEKMARKALALSLKRGDYWKDVSARVEVLRKTFDLQTERFVAAARLECEMRRRRKLLNREGVKLSQVPLPGDESFPVLCVLMREAWGYMTEEDYEMTIEIGDCAHAIHYSWLCYGKEPCVVICLECDSDNIASILVHESIHHALSWTKSPPEEDHLDDIEHYLEENGIRMEGFSKAG